MRRIAFSILGICLVILMVAVGVCVNIKASGACGRTVTCSLFDLKIRDQDESWSNGVKDTWSVHDMKPGEEYPFSSSFVRLKQLGFIAVDHLEITMDYSLRETGCMSFGTFSADDMARYIIITRLEYYTNDWKIDLLSGGYSGKPPHLVGLRSGDWSISDVDGDEKKTFCDFKVDRLKNLPPPQFWKRACDAPYVRMSVKLSDQAGNECMGACFDFTVSYTVYQCRWK